MLLIIVPVLITLSAIGLILGRWRVAHRKQTRLRQLRTWATESSTLDPLLQQWFQQMSPPELELMLELLQGYCASLQWELDWLFTPQIKNAPALHTALVESVSAYARTILLSLQMAEDVRVYQIYLAFEKRPNARRQQMLVEQLYAKIHDQHETPTVRGFFRKFSGSSMTHSERVAAIQQAFAREPGRTMAALKEVVSAEHAITAEYIGPSLTSSTYMTSSTDMTSLR